MDAVARPLWHREVMTLKIHVEGDLINIHNIVYVDDKLTLNLK